MGVVDVVESATAIVNLFIVVFIQRTVVLVGDTTTVAVHGPAAVVVQNGRTPAVLRTTVYCQMETLKKPPRKRI